MIEKIYNSIYVNSDKMMGKLRTRLVSFWYFFVIFSYLADKVLFSHYKKVMEVKR